ncbi:MAG: hypothetical protein AAGC55_02055, partial [Myxococcota bacterium]
STCNYNVGTNSGSLTSPVVGPLGPASTLSFDYFRQVESYPGSYDRTWVEVSDDGGATWTAVWQRDSSNPSENAWVSSGAISLAQFAGSAVQVRFFFETRDGIANNFTGWMIDNVVIDTVSSCPAFIDFDVDTAGNPLPAGTLLNDQWAGQGLHISCFNNRNTYPQYHPDECITFDSGNPTGGDFDLGTPHQDFGGPGYGEGGGAGLPGENSQAHHNIMIIAENIDDWDSDGLVDEPNDETHGGQVHFNFDEPVDLETITLIDIDGLTEVGTAVVVCTDNGGASQTFATQPLGNDSIQTLQINLENIVHFAIDFKGSGGMTSLSYRPSEGQ